MPVYHLLSFENKLYTFLLSLCRLHITLPYLFASVMLSEKYKLYKLCM